MYPVKEEGMARLRRDATGRVVLLTTSVFVVFNVALFNLCPVPAVVEAAGSPLLDNRFAWTREDARSCLSVLGDEGRGLYGVVLALDADYAVTFATAGALLLAWISARIPFSTSPLQWVALLPTLAGVIACLCVGGMPQNNWLLLAIPRRLLAYEPVRISGPSQVSTKVSSAFAARSEGFQAKDWPSSISCRVSGVATISREA
jgi:hypothetical protein